MIYLLTSNDAGWSSPVARQAHNLKVVGSNPTPATKMLFKFYCCSEEYFWMEPCLGALSLKHQRISNADLPFALRIIFPKDNELESHEDFFRRG